MSDRSDVMYLPEVARKLDMTEAAVRGHIQRRTDAIPPYFHLSQRKLAWRRETFDEWIRNRERQAQSERVVRRARRRSDGSTS